MGAPGTVTIRLTPDLEPWYPLQETRINIDIRDVDGNLADPGSLTLRIYRPDNTEADFNITQVVRTNVGQYYYDLLFDSSFNWVIRVETQSPNAAEEVNLEVSQSVFSTSIGPPPVPGAGFEGDIAKVIGGVWTPYAGAADQEPLIWVAGTGWVSQALNLASTNAVSGNLAITHIAPGSANQVLITNGSGNVQWLTGPIPAGAGGGNQQLQYNNAGSLDGTQGIKVGTSATEWSLQFFGSAGTAIPASTGALNFYDGAQLMYGRNHANTADLAILLWGVTANDVLSIGDSTVGAGIVLGTGSGNISLKYGGSLAYQFGSTSAAFGTSSIQWGAHPSTGGLLNFSHGQIIIEGRDSANTNDLGLLLWGITGTNILTIGESSVSMAELRMRVAGSGILSMYVSGGQEFQFDATNLTMNGNNLLMGGGFIGMGSAVPAYGALRMLNNSFITGRNNSNSVSYTFLGIDIANILWLGSPGSDVTNLNINYASTLQVQQGGVNQFHIVGSQITFDLIGQIQGLAFITLSDNFTHPSATTGLIRTSNNFGAVNSRNAANTADVELIRLNGSDQVIVGGVSVGVSQAATVAVNPSSQFLIIIGGTTIATFSSGFGLGSGVGITAAFFAAQTGNVAAAGLLRGNNNTVMTAARNAASTADIQVTATDSSNNILIGQPGASPANPTVNVNQNTNFQIQIIGTTEYSFTSTQITMNANNIVGTGFISNTGTVSASGFVRDTNATVTITARNAANSADINEIGTDASNNILIGQTGATPQNPSLVVNSTTSLIINVAGTTEYTLNATQITMNGNNLVMGTGFVSFQASLTIGSGRLRVDHGTNILVGRNNAGTADAIIISWGAVATDTIAFSDGTVNIIERPVTSWATMANATVALEVAYLASARRVLSLVKGSSLTTTDIPTNAGDLVVFIGNAATVPTANPANGIVLWAASGQSLRQRNTAGVEEHITHLNGGTTTGTTKQIVSRDNKVQTTNATATTIDSFTIPSGAVVQVRVHIVGKNSTTTTEKAAYDLRGGAFDNAGTAVLLGTPAKDAFEVNAAWDANIIVTGATVAIQVTGIAANNIDWWCVWEIVVLVP